MPNHDWNETYKIGDLPWDIGNPDEHLINLIESKTISPCRTLEVGCGTGTNSLWLARHGFSVLGVDMAQAAVDLANAKKKDKSLTCEFAVMDFLQNQSLPQSFEFVFDRGCFHVFDEDSERFTFAAQVSRVLKTNGIWVSLIGSTEGGPRDSGPPRRTAIEVIKAIEPHLEILELRSVSFQSNHPYSAKAWLCMTRKREEPAQPSTRH